MPWRRNQNDCVQPSQARQKNAVKRKPGPIVPISGYDRIETDRKCGKCEAPAMFGNHLCAPCWKLIPEKLSIASVAIVRPCSHCGAETRHKKECPTCGIAVTFVPKAPTTKRELEAPIKERTRVALIAAGANVWVHNIDNRQMSTGLGTGTSDLICIVPPHGRFLAIEMKRPGYSPSDVTPAQRCFINAVRKFGGVAGVASSEAEALALLAEARQECPMGQSST